MNKYKLYGFIKFYSRAKIVELVSDRVTIKETHFVYNKPKLIKSIGNKYTRKALNMLSKNMIVNRVVTG
jgi:hypothetical protein